MFLFVFCLSKNTVNPIFNVSNAKPIMLNMDHVHQFGGIQGKFTSLFGLETDRRIDKEKSRKTKFINIF